MLSKTICIVLMIFIISGCKPAGKVVEAMTAAILREVLIQSNYNEDLGEMSVGSDNKIIEITVVNNSSNSIQKMELVFEGSHSSLDFLPDEDFIVASPGFEGDCGTYLASGDTCKFRLEFSTRKAGTFSSKFKINYENTLKPESKIFSFKGVVGEPASLVFTNDKTLYDFGVIEQTDTTEKDLSLEIQNVGGLSARSVNFNLENTTGTAFRLKSIDCPSIIEPNQICHAVISYRPYNNNYSDAEQRYEGKLSFGYFKDPEGKTSKLNGIFKFLASTIEAKMTTNFAPIVYDTLTAGTKSTKMVKVANTGYNFGYLKSLTFKDYTGLTYTSCIKGSGSFLNCQKNLDEFPFLVEDLNDCFNKQVKGVEGKVLGDNCYFNVTYWPSKTWLPGSQSIHYFNESTIDVVYDSQWKNQENIVTKSDLFNITADFRSVAKLVVDKVKIEQDTLPLSSLTLNASGYYEANLGRIAKVSDANYDTYIQVTYKNIGESSAVLQELRDGAASKFVVHDLGTDLNVYYKGVKYTNCDIVAVNDTCTVGYSLVPLALGNSQTEDSYMYDDTSNALNKFKKFYFEYKDGSDFEDDGNPSVNKILELRMTSKLVAKGSLAFVDSLSQTLTQIVNGNTLEKRFKLKNIGTGEIYAISHHSSYNFLPHSGLYDWPFKVIDLSTVNSPATKDCFDILYPANQPTVSDTPNTSKFLAPNEVCELGIEVAAPLTMRWLSSNFGPGKDIQERNRFFSEYVTDTEMWQRRGATYSPLQIRFEYFDGDVDPDNSASVPFGLKKATKDMFVTPSIRGAAYLIFANPTPIQSAILVRPAMTYPTVTTSYPLNITQASYSVTQKQFSASDYTSVSNLFTTSDYSKTYYSGLGENPSEFTYFIGTFKVGETIKSTVDLTNVALTAASGLTLTDEMPTETKLVLSKLNNVTSPYPAFSVASNQLLPMEFTFTPNVPGFYRKCYLLDYSNGISGNSTRQSICALANAVSSAADFKFQVQDINVTYNSATDTVTESPTGIWNDFTSTLNDKSSGTVSFNGIRNSKAYALKLVRITNIGDSTATKTSFSFETALNVPGSVISEISTVNSNTGNPTCSTNMTINPGSSCDIYIKYKPTTSTTAIYTPFIGVVFERITNQFASKSLALQFNAVDPAKIAASGLTAEPVTNWKTPTAPLPVAASYPLNLNSYSKTNSHLLIVNNPTSKVFTYNFVNSSTMKASFLSMNSNPTSTWNNIYSDSNMLIQANKGCFYGDDESNNLIAAEDKGFNSATTTTNKCQIKFTFSGNYTYATCSAWNAATKTKVPLFGGNIVSTCNPYVYELNYYNYKRSTTEKIYVHVKGFIEPNRITASGGALTNVTSVSTSSTKGSIGFTLPTLTANNSSYGAMTTYRIFYSTNYDDLWSINSFYAYNASPAMTYFDTTSSTVTIPNLNKGVYYFFRVASRRSYSHPTEGTLAYTSMSDLPILSLPIPDQDTFYIHSQKALVDKKMNTTAGTRDQAVTKCSSLKYTYSIKGVSKQFTKSLIGTSQWNEIIKSSSNSSGYPTGSDPGTVPHWLSDGQYNIATSISLYNGTTLPGFPGFVNSNLTGSDANYDVIYSKTCSNSSSCNLLYKVVGGDDVDLYYQGTFYTTSNGVSAYPRCYAVIPCPTNTGILITNGSCANP